MTVHFLRIICGVLCPVHCSEVKVHCLEIGTFMMFFVSYTLLLYTVLEISMLIISSVLYIALEWKSNVKSLAFYNILCPIHHSEVELDRLEIRPFIMFFVLRCTRVEVECLVFRIFFYVFCPVHHSQAEVKCLEFTIFLVSFMLYSTLKWTVAI